MERKGRTRLEKEGSNQMTRKGRDGSDDQKRKRVIRCPEKGT
jgi:hypothetical protein